MFKARKFISMVLAVIMCAALISLPIFSSAAEPMYDSLQNCGFENPVITSSSKQVNVDTVPNWNTTAYGKLIELLKENTGVYIPQTKLKPREGKQAAELNADEASSLYQAIKTTPGTFVKWGISHHGRNGYDTMLLVIGPNQSVEPAKAAKNGKDQFMKMGDYIKSNSKLSALIPENDGASQEIVIYSPKFAANGNFVTGEIPGFTTYRTASNTEQWHIWFIRSNNDKWYDYGTNVTSNTGALGYNNIYEVPSKQTQTMFAFTAYDNNQTNIKDSAKLLTFGNIIDSISFGLLHNVTVNVLKGGDASVLSNGENDLNVSYKNTDLASDKYKAGSTVTLKVMPDDAADYLFTGASINDKFYGYDLFKANGTKTVYTKDILVDDSKFIKAVFARKGHLIYNPNGGTFRGNKDVTDMEYTYYTNGLSETEVPLNSSAAFTDWTLYSNDGKYNGIKIPAEHNVVYNADDASNPTLTITWDGGSVEIPATRESGITFIANYLYKHEVVALTDGGSVSIENVTKENPVTGDSVHKTTAGEEGNTITVTAVPDAGYQFDGWFESENGSAISKALKHSYVVTDNSIIYAKFSKEKKEVIIEEEAPIEKPLDKPEYVIPDFGNSYAYIYGYNDVEMAAENDALRGEVAGMLHRLLKQNNKLGGFVYNQSKPAKFKDIDGRWYRSAIEYMTYKGVFDESEEYSFPERPVTRGEAFKMICLGLSFTSDSSLTNEQYALILKDAGFVEGFEDGSLGIDDNLTRAQFCTMYNRIIGRNNASLRSADGEEITAATYGFKDLDPKSWYYKDMLRATSAYDDDGNVDLNKRGIRNNLDDYIG